MAPYHCYLMPKVQYTLKKRFIVRNSTSRFVFQVLTLTVSNFFYQLFLKSTTLCVILPCKVVDEGLVLEAEVSPLELVCLYLYHLCYLRSALVFFTDRF